jgi:peptidoglycan/LPS O-acetylase OafA/YrhL
MLTLVPAGATGSARDLALYGHLHGQLHGRPVLIFFGHFWSLCVEEQFYLAWPWVVFWVRDRRRLMWICAISLPLCLALRMVSENALPLSITVNHPAHELLVCRADALLTGGLIALWLRGPGADALLRWSRWLFPVAMTAAFTWAFLVPPRWMKWHFYPFPSWLNTWGLLAIELLAGLLLLNLLQPSNPLYKVFNLRPLRFLGRISYGMYVFHDIVHGPLNSLANWLLPGSLWLTSVLALAGTILLAWLSFRFLESPFLNMKERWTRTA